MTRTSYQVSGPLPPQALSPNRERNIHWSAKARAVREYRQIWALLFRAARIPPMGRIAVSLDFYTARSLMGGFYRPHDCGNALASCKSLLDGLVDAGGYLWRGEERIPCPEEEDFFAALHLPVLEPRERTEDGIAKLRRLK